MYELVSIEVPTVAFPGFCPLKWGQASRSAIENPEPTASRQSVPEPREAAVGRGPPLFGNLL